MGYWTPISSNANEVYDSARESISPDGETNASVQLDVPYDERIAIVQDLATNFRLWPKGDLSNIPRVTSVRVSKLIGKVEFPSTESFVYELARLDVEYSTSTAGEEKDGTLLYTETVEPSLEFLTLDPVDFLWSPSLNQLTEAEAPGKQIHGLTIKRTTYRVATIPPETYTLIGSVNVANYNSKLLDQTFAPETLLYRPPNLLRSFSTTGTKGWTVQTSFMYKPEGWNTFWRAESGSYEEMIVNVEGFPTYKNYPLKDFSALLY